MKLSTFVLVAVTTMIVTACSQPDTKLQKSSHTVSWFLKHNEILDQTLKLCSDDPAKYNQEPDCINALHAANQRSAGSLHPIDWSKGENPRAQ